MNDQSFTRAGGSILAFSIIAGVVGGTVAGQASAGFVVGLATGVALALMLWWKDRRG